LYWTFAAFFLFLSMLAGIYDTVKTYMEIRFWYETSKGENLHADASECLTDGTKMGS
jgi:hypothetical protein